MERVARRTSRTRSWPQTRTAPAVGRNSPVSTLMVVVLPAPLGPSRANNSPGGTVSVSPSDGDLAGVAASHVVELNHGFAARFQVPPPPARRRRQSSRFLVGQAHERDAGAENRRLLLQHRAVAADPEPAPRLLTAAGAAARLVAVDDQPGAHPLPVPDDRLRPLHRGAEDFQLVLVGPKGTEDRHASRSGRCEGRAVASAAGARRRRSTRRWTADE